MTMRMIIIRIIRIIMKIFIKMPIREKIVKVITLNNYFITLSLFF